MFKKNIRALIKQRVKFALLILAAGLPFCANARAGFGVGDEQQQFQQMQQLRNIAAPASTASMPAASPSMTSAKIGLPPTTAVAGPLNAVLDPLNPDVGEPMFNPAAVLGNADQPAPSDLANVQQNYSAFIPYSGPPNRWAPLSANEAALNDAAFTGAVTTTFPMTTEQIHQLKQVYTASQEAAAAAPGVPPRPTVTSQIVSIAPGSTPPVIRLAQGFVSSLVFVDSTGAPWPIEAYDIGNPTAFSIQWNHTDNTLMIQSMTLYTYGNLAVRLKGLATPVMLTLIPGQRAVDYRVDLRIQGIGPNANLASGTENLPNAATPQLLEVLDGVPPHAAKLMTVNGGEAQAWLLGDKLYVRTRLTVLSPAWRATMSSADGMNAYELQRTPMVLASFHGKPIQLRIEGF